MIKNTTKKNNKISMSSDKPIRIPRKTYSKLLLSIFYKVYTIIVPCILEIKKRLEPQGSNRFFIVS